MKSLLRSVATLVVATVAFSTQSTLAQITERVSVSSVGAQGNGQSGNVSISADGRFVLFSSNASTLVAGDTNGDYDTFVHDRTTGTTERVSVSTGGAQASSSSFANSNRISGDGRFVTFGSAASNLVAGDTNGTLDIFVRDRQSGTTERVSVDSVGAQANDGTDDAPAISTDGRFVAFASWASNLVAGDTNARVDVFVRDLQNGTTERVSVDSTGGQGNAASGRPSISADGRFVAYESDASNLVIGDTNGSSDVFVHDRATGTTERVSTDSTGAQANSFSLYGAVSGDGRFVAFTSSASNLVASDSNAGWDAFVHDRTTGTTERVSVDSSGAQQTNSGLFADSLSISADGRFVAFGSNASNLVANDINGTFDIFVHDRQTGITERASLATGGGQGNDQSGRPTISADGSIIAFFSYATTLVIGDTNNSGDAFVQDRGLHPPIPYCTAGTTSHGCSASISANANPSVSFANACSVTVTNVEGQKTGILFYNADNSGFTPSAWGSGSTSWECVGSPSQRTPIQSSGGTSNACDGSYVLDWNAYQTAHPLALGNPWSLGDHVYVQAWFRDPPAAKGTNLSNALELTYQP